MIWKAIARISHRLAVAALLASALAGCVRTEPSRYYLLAPLPAETPTRAPGAADGPSIGVGPVDLPAHLDRPQIVTRTGANRLVLAEFDSWAEPLKDNVSRVLAENLSRLVPSDNVVIYPAARAMRVDYQVTVGVRRLDADSAGEVAMVVHWRLFSDDGRTLLTSRRFERRVTAPPGDLEAIVAAQSALLSQLSREIAAAVRAAAGRARASPSGPPPA